MITKEDVLLLHSLSIDAFGGGHGIRDIGLLESAIARPFQQFNNQDLYPTIVSKAAAIFESLVVNHPFVDGNKRTGLLAMYAILDLNNLQLNASEESMYQFTIDVASGKKNIDSIVAWLTENIY